MAHTTTRPVAVVAVLAQTGRQNPGLPEKGLRKSILTVCFFNVNYSPLFTIRKNIINTVR
ncbi:hypothetical protein FK505_18440 [Klebsiella pneumoniae]|nr:hypothetical protein [Klebsiella pneumoniae]HBZ0936994.1 hypothetical protein [Klebsiella pneumoniae]